MSRTWLIARHHFLFEARKRSFLILLFSLPLFIALVVGLSALATNLFTEAESVAIGYVDPADFLHDVALDHDELELHAFGSAEEARAALERGEIAAYYLLAADFESSRNADLVYYEPPGGGSHTAFSELIRQSRLDEVPPELAERAMTEAALTVRALDSGREFGANPTVADFLPLLVALMFGFLAVTTSGYMMEVLVAEKENRTMEIVISSVSSAKVMTGKIAGALGIAGMQLLVWIACLLLAVIIGRAAGVAWLMELEPRWRDIAQIVIVAIPVYFCLAALFTMVGSTLVDSNDAQQIGPVILLILIVPVYFMPVMIDQPQGTVALALSFFPPTAITTFALRMLMVAIPWWQVFVSVSISLVSALALTWVAAKAFRLGMLRYGQRLRLGELLRHSPRKAGEGV